MGSEAPKAAPRKGARTGDPASSRRRAPAPEYQTLNLLAHELNQPLAAIANYAEACRLIIEHGHDGAPLADNLERIAEQAQRAGDIARQLLAVVAPPRKPDPFDLNRLLRRVATTIADESVGGDEALRLDLTPGLALAFGNERVLEVVVHDLLHETVERYAGQPVRLESRADGAWVRVCIVPMGASEAPFADEGYETPTRRVDRLLVERQNGSLSRQWDADGPSVHLRLPIAP